MSTLLDNPTYLSAFADRAARIWQRKVDQRQHGHQRKHHYPVAQTVAAAATTTTTTTSPATAPPPPPLAEPMYLVSWCQGQPPVPQEIKSLDELQSAKNSWDLAILVASRDDPTELPYFPQLCRILNIPGQFVSEGLQSVTHSFGMKWLDNGSHTSWLHLLSSVPSDDPLQNLGWIRPGFVLNCSPSAVQGRFRVTLTCFEPPATFWDTLHRLTCSDDFQDVLCEPYLLFALILEDWYNFVDKNVWELVHLCREEEKSIFQQANTLQNHKTAPLALDYSRIHAIAKDVLHLIECADSSLRSLSCVMQSHARLKSSHANLSNAVQDALRHRQELFSSTRIRLASVDQRLKNIINLAFHIQTLRDSNVIQEDSYTMKSLAVVAMVFLPISTISSIFGMQFFNSVEDPESSTSSITVSRDFWIFWSIAVPFTSVLIIGWLAWLKGLHLPKKGARVGLEKFGF